MRAYRNNEYLQFLAEYEKHGWLLLDSTTGGVKNAFKIASIRFQEDIDYFYVQVNNTYYTLGDMYNKFSFYNPQTKSTYKIGKK